jgi:hypothetical protein
MSANTLLYRSAESHIKRCRPIGEPQIRLPPSPMDHILLAELDQSSSNVLVIDLCSSQLLGSYREVRDKIRRLKCQRR